MEQKLILFTNHITLDDLFILRRPIDNFNDKNFAFLTLKVQDCEMSFNFINKDTKKYNDCKMYSRLKSNMINLQRKDERGKKQLLNKI